MEIDKKFFALKFKPHFISSDLKLCSDGLTEKEEIEFVMRFWPFSKYREEKVKTFDIKLQHRKIIKEEWNKELPSKIFTFDDDKVFSTVWPCIEQDLEDFLIKKENINPSKKIRSEFPEINELKKLYEPLVKSTVYCERGHTLEKRIIKSVNQSENFNFLHNKNTQEIDFGFCILKGKPDGIDSQKNSIIEVKSKNSIQPVSEKERLQCLSYLRILKFQTCLLVQSDRNGEKKIFNIFRDDQEFTERIYYKLKDFVTKYRNMTEEEFLEKLFIYKENYNPYPILVNYLHDS
ncbi:hypothetical protein BpHYR1_003737 [Brachionus plicatilis]|uniref:YqaJ viral recombinase domain-containing protein n=1 Tax=Brachionus plicatilis TaxID=10195 RepID=A0A3M7QT24_BRAPC|nr:hypothetical protein BpHYR1_003737 [Brachionus plicatilis]